MHATKREVRNGVVCPSVCVGVCGHYCDLFFSLLRIGALPFPALLHKRGITTSEYGWNILYFTLFFYCSSVVYTDVGFFLHFCFCNTFSIYFRKVCAL